MWLALTGLCAAVLSLAGSYLYLDPQIPNAESYRHVQLETPLRVYSEDGALLAEFGERRLIPIELEQVPQQFINALLNTEDKRFYEHSGIDFISLANDMFDLAVSMVFEGEITPGASTITMQLARNVSFTLDQRFLRKFKEMLLAMKIEQQLTKDEILELYINVVPFGKRAYGAQTAALTYYGKELDQLNLAQLAMLAGIPQRPSASNPINGPERAVARRNVVLSLMRAQDSITQSQYEQAAAEPISARIYERELDVPSPYPAEWVRQQANVLFDDIYTGGYEVYTTINSRTQKAAIEALKKELENYDRRHGYRGAEATVPDALSATIKTNEATLTSELAAAQSAQISRDADEAADVAGGQVAEGQAAGGQAAGADGAGPDDEIGVADLPLSYPTEATNEIRDFLRDIPLLGNLEPAVVVAINASQAAIVTGDGSITRLHLADSSWARPYIEVDLRGPKIESFAEIFQSGDLIRLREKADGGWQLAQLADVQGAVVTLESETGKVRALVGGYDFYRNQYNHALQAARQPGSGFKPFVYSTAIASGITPADIFMDAPLVFDDENLEEEYRPGNDNSQYNGPTRLREALYSSINLVSIRVLLEIGAGKVLDYVPNFGFSTKTFPRNTQLAIGGGTMAITPVDMARAYSVIANGGYLIEPYIVDFVKNYDGDVVFRSNHPAVCHDCGNDEQRNQGNVPDENAQRSSLASETEPATLEDLLAQPSDSAGLLPDTTPETASGTTSGTTSGTISDAALIESTTDPSAAEPSTANDLASTNDSDAAEAMAAIDDLSTTSRWEDLETIAAPRVIDERNAYIMHTMLQDVIRRGTGRRARELERGDLAGKTGTTNEAADTWFNGYGGGLTTSVWVGFSNHTSLGANAYGSNIPLPIWIDVMREALDGQPEITRQQPPGVVTVKIDPKTGKPASPGQSSAIFEYFLREFAPKIGTDGESTTTAEEGEIKAVDLF